MIQLTIAEAHMTRLLGLVLAFLLAVTAPTLAQVCNDDVPPPPPQGDKPST